MWDGFFFVFIFQFLKYIIYYFEDAFQMYRYKKDMINIKIYFLNTQWKLKAPFSL